MIDPKHKNWDINKGDYKRDYTETNRFLIAQERRKKTKQFLLVTISISLLFSALYGIFYLMSE